MELHQDSSDAAAVEGLGARAVLDALDSRARDGCRKLVSRGAAQCPIALIYLHASGSCLGRQQQQQHAGGGQQASSHRHLRPLQRPPCSATQAPSQHSAVLPPINLFETQIAYGLASPTSLDAVCARSCAHLERRSRRVREAAVEYR